jgi:hypothetical protein
MRIVSVSWRMPLQKVDAAVAAEIIEDVIEREGGISYAAVVEVARDEKNPLHGEFDWNDDSASQAWREEQARKLMANLLVVYRREDGGEIAGPIRLLVPERRYIPDAPTKRFISIRHRPAPTLEDEVRDAEQRLWDWVRKHSHLEPLQPHISAILEVLNGTGVHR